MIMNHLWLWLWLLQLWGWIAWMVCKADQLISFIVNKIVMLMIAKYKFPWFASWQENLNLLMPQMRIIHLQMYVSLKQIHIGIRQIVGLDTSTYMLPTNLNPTRYSTSMIKTRARPNTWFWKMIKMGIGHLITCYWILTPDISGTVQLNRFWTLSALSATSPIALKPIQASW